MREALGAEREMSQDFNPYRDWLGVTSPNPAPSYYELLGLRPLEADIGKINAAYQRQSTQLATRLSSSQAGLAQRLMSELAEARMTLMTPTAKRAYDQALAARGPAAPVTTARQSDALSASDIQEILPPAASPQAVGPASAVAPNPGATAYPAAMPHQPYAGQGYAGGPYAAPQAYPAPVAMASYPAQAVPNHYGVPHVGAEVAPVQPQPAEAMPSIRRRRVRRRSSPVPALFGAAVVVAGILGGIWFFYKGDETVAVIHSGDSTSQANPSSQLEREGTPVADMRTLGTNGTRTDTQGDMATPANTQGPAGVSDSNDEQSMPVIDPPEPENGMPAMDKPGKDGSEPRPERPTADTPSDKPTRNAKPSEASPEEAAAVTKALKDVRAALAGRDLTKAKDLLDEATIEATAPDTVAQLNRVEMLTSYVEMFWDAARKTLPKLQAAETIEIDGKMVAIVEADEEHLVVRIEGRNREYNWTKIPPRIAYYLADRWLAKDDPVRNLVLAAFEIVEPKGDLAHAERLLDAASAARLNAEPLYAELKAARGG